MELNTKKQSIKKFLSEIGENNFIIPDFQRPYAWDKDTCETLWSDITDAFNTNPKEDYFLGTIVSNKAGDDVEIIDGQQRITTLMLLLRAFYTEVEDPVAADARGVAGIKSSLESCIWKVDESSGTKKDGIHLVSKVDAQRSNDALHVIFASGQADGKTKHHENYKFFLDKINEVKFSIWEDLCKFVMNKCIILPIECNNQETALTIFQTLNNRGLDLQDADIFKAQIYRSKGTPEAQKSFTDQWNGLVEICEAAKLEVDDIFRYYTHVLRGKEENIHNEIALRKFYSKGRLEDDSLMGDVIHLAKFWACLNSGGGYDDDIDSKINAETRQWVHCLSKYPNDYWKYVTSVYFHCRHVDENFAEGLTAFLKDTVRFLFLKFIEQVGINRIKPGIYNGCVNIYKNKSPVFNSIKIEDFEKRLEHPPKALVSSLLLLHAYLNPDQKERPIRSDSLQIEHIFPKQWQDANYNGWNRADADQYLEKFGNKVICHRKVNIQAGNNYFGRKKEKYEGNAIANVAKLANYESDDWTKVDIDKRQEKVTKELREFFGYLLA